jgi:hypothetical protein
MRSEGRLLWLSSRRLISPEPELVGTITMPWFGVPLSQALTMSATSTLTNDSLRKRNATQLASS